MGLPGKFIESDEGFRADVLRLVANPGDPRVMGGQTPRHAPLKGRWTADDKPHLLVELHRWEANATQTALANQLTLLSSAAAVFADELLADERSPLDAKTAGSLINEALFVALDRLAPAGILADLLKGGLNVLVDKLVESGLDAQAAPEREGRRAAFVRTFLRFGGELQSQLAEPVLSDIRRLSHHYHAWLEHASAEELSRFRIPFSPQRLSEERLSGTLRSALRDALAAASRAPRDTPHNSAIITQLANDGIQLEQDGLERLHQGGAAGAEVTSSLLFKRGRYIPPPSATDVARGDRVRVYLFPRAATEHMTPDLVELISRQLQGHAGIVVLYEKTASHAIYDLALRRWVTGEVTDVE
jgi:hypothetical protein